MVVVLRINRIKRDHLNTVSYFCLLFSANGKLWFNCAINCDIHALLDVGDRYKKSIQKDKLQWGNEWLCFYSFPGDWLHFRIFTPSLLDSHSQRLVWAYLIACYLFSIYRVWCTLSLLKKRLKWKSTFSFSSLDYPLKRDGVESGERSVAGHERKRAAFSSSSS